MQRVSWLCEAYPAPKGCIRGRHGMAHRLSSSMGPACVAFDPAPPPPQHFWHSGASLPCLSP